MDCFKYFIVQPNSVIFVKEGTTNIIVSGDVVSYDHRQNFDRPKIVAYY